MTWRKETRVRVGCRNISFAHAFARSREQKDSRTKLVCREVGSKLTSNFPISRWLSTSNHKFSGRNIASLRGAWFDMVRTYGTISYNRITTISITPHTIITNDVIIVSIIGIASANFIFLRAERKVLWYVTSISGWVFFLVIIADN